MNRRIFDGWLVSALVAAVLCAQGVLAEPGFYETEPNNTPAEANAVAGEVTLYGSMVKGDQDGFMWTVSDDDARKLWSFELHGVPGALTIAEIVRVEYTENGAEVASIRRLVKMGTRDGLTPSIHANLMFEPGEYLIGIAYAGGGAATAGGAAPFRPPAAGLSFGDEGQPENTLARDGAAVSTEEPGAYRLMIREGENIYAKSDNKSRESREQAAAIRLRQTFTAFESHENSWYSMEFDEKAATQRWNIGVQVPVGRKLSARLVDSGGTELASASVDDFGLLAFAEMAPEATTWFLELSSAETGFIRSVITEITGQRVSGEEAEPNGELNLANFVDLSQPLTGRITADDSWDYFRFTVDEDTADELLTLRIESNPPVKLSLCLSAAVGTVLQCRDGETPVELPDLLLNPGPWRLSVSRAKETEYSISMSRQGPVTAGSEVEPNDRIEDANGVPANLRIKGRFSGEDSDYYQLLVTGEPQLWRFQVVGDEMFELHYYNGGMKDQASMRAAQGQRRLQLENLFLMPGRHFLKVSGHDGGSYTLLARALGPPDPDGEIEPNDQSNKQRLALGQTRKGTLAEKNDRDYYRFFLANHEHIRLTIQPPADGAIDTYLYWYGANLAGNRPAENGEPLTIEGLFQPGDYSFWIGARQVSDAEYTVKLERLPRFSCPADCEPSGLNNKFFQAAPLPTDLVLVGKSGEWGDWDYYRLPEFEAPVELVMHSSKPVREVGIGTLGSNRQRLTWEPEQGVYRTTVPAGEASLIMLDSRQEDYRLELEFPDGQVKPVVQALAAELDLRLDSGTVSAFRTAGQQVHGELKLENTGSAVLQLELEAATSDYRWTVTLDRSGVAMAAGGSASVPVTVQVPADAWADRPVIISVRARDPLGAQVETWKGIDVDRDTPPVNPNLYWPLPEALRGGFNIAWTPLGADWHGEQPRTDRPDLLRDNLVFPGHQIACCSQNGGWARGQEPAFTLKLPGTEPMPVAGVALNHFGTTNPFKNIRKATLLLSLDGVEFNEVMHIDLLPVLTAQYFALDKPLQARFARLRIDDTYEERDGDGRVFFSEWKVILQPGFDPSVGAGFNIANPDLGGHLVWDWPPEPYSPTSVLVEGDASNRAGIRREPAKDYVIGFNHNRAAQITRLEWHYREGLDDRWKQFSRVLVSASLGSPVGPWQDLGEMDLGGQKNAASLELPEATWVRFVRFTAYLAEGERQSEEPGVLKVWERPAGDGYLSVLGEWGGLGSRGYYEQLAGVQAEEAPELAGNESRETAAPLAAGNAARGQVALGKLEHWYRHRVEGPDNTLVIELTGDPTVRTVVALEDEAGNELPLRRTDRKDVFSRQVFEAVVEPGGEVWLRISEPPRNVIFTWDTSASVNAYIPQINNSLIAFSGEVAPGREAVNLMPFSMGPLLEEWYGEPYKLQTILNDYRRIGSSSSAEETMKRATLELAPLAGTKAMVLITDAQTPHDGELWGPLQTVRPRIFGIGVAGDDMGDQNRFRDWASVNAGTYNQLIYDGEMEVAFDRASTLMHRPAGYTVKVQSEFREAPGPGKLRVVDNADEGARAGAAVELILDASGSMLKRMEGKRRIAVAKEVLTEAVQQHIPAGTPLALRVFGHKQADACRTDLEIPLQPLDPKAAAAKIAGIQAMNLARTPIADSLKAVKSDLKNAGGAAAVVLVTDGEETCEGDPGAVIEALQAEGMQINLNIVGFAIDNVELAEQFRTWAELGGGRYFAANDQAGLSGALGEALKVSYTVYDQGGNEVATGQVGANPVELEQGFYRVVVHSLPQQAFDKVAIQAEDELVLELK